MAIPKSEQLNDKLKIWEETKRDLEARLIEVDNLITTNEEEWDALSSTTAFRNIIVKNNVDGVSGPSYVVTNLFSELEPECTCPDYMYRKRKNRETCKHIDNLREVLFNYINNWT